MVCERHGDRLCIDMIDNGSVMKLPAAIDCLPVVFKVRLGTLNALSMFQNWCDGIFVNRILQQILLLSPTIVSRSMDLFFVNSIGVSKTVFLLQLSLCQIIL